METLLEGVEFRTFTVGTTILVQKSTNEETKPVFLFVEKSGAGTLEMVIKTTARGPCGEPNLKRMTARE